MSDHLLEPVDAERPVSLCVINYNGKEHLVHSLGAARGSRLGFGEVLLVDNGSTDGSLELVKHCYPEVRVLALARNEGPASARNAGFLAARHDLVLFVDNDVVIERDCAAELRTALSRWPGVLVAMPRVLYAKQPDIIQYQGADCHFLGHMIPRYAEMRVPDAPSTVEEVDSVITACFLIDRGVWGTSPPFDASFVFNYEDHDFGVRSRVLGHRLLAVPSATCLHGSGTPGLSYRPGEQQAPLRVYCLMRNRWRIVLQSYAFRTLLLLSPVLLLFELFQFFGAVRRGWLRIWLRAAAWLLSHPGVTAAGRGRLQQARRMRDRAILQDGDLPLTSGLLRSPLERAAYRGLNRVTRAYWRLVESRL